MNNQRDGRVESGLWQLRDTPESDLVTKALRLEYGLVQCLVVDGDRCDEGRG